MEADFSIVPHGDSALLVTFGDAINPLTNARVHAAAGLARTALSGGAPWSMPIPAYASVLVGYDALKWSVGEAQGALAELLRPLAGAAIALDSGPLIEIPVRYGGDDGPDLDAVAERCGLSADQVVEVHCSVVYRAYMLGFSPGFAYLGELPAALELPRRETPRVRVPAGCVAIAGRQTAVYPQSTPGGWHLIGRTDLPLWDASGEPPALITAGASIRFVPRA